MGFQKEESEIDNPNVQETVNTFLELINLCHETRKEQSIELELGGPDLGDSILVTITYKGNKNANVTLN